MKNIDVDDQGNTCSQASTSHLTYNIQHLYTLLPIFLQLLIWWCTVKCDFFARTKLCDIDHLVYLWVWGLWVFGVCQSLVLCVNNCLLITWNSKTKLVNKSENKKSPMFPNLQYTLKQTIAKHMYNESNWMKKNIALLLGLLDTYICTKLMIGALKISTYKREFAKLLFNTSALFFF